MNPTFTFERPETTALSTTFNTPSSFCVTPSDHSAQQWWAHTWPDRESTTWHQGDFSDSKQRGIVTFFSVGINQKGKHTPNNILYKKNLCYKTNCLTNKSPFSLT